MLVHVLFARATDGLMGRAEHALEIGLGLDAHYRWDVAGPHGRQPVVSNIDNALQVRPGPQ